MSKKNTLFVLFTLFAMSMATYSVTGAAVSPVAQAAPIPAVRAESQTATRTITVVGEGKISLEPDVATINAGAEARANTVAEAKAEVETIMAAINAALQWMNISERDIQTNHYVIHFEREPLPALPEGFTQETRGKYYVSDMAQVIIRDVDKAGDVLDAVIQAGGNQVYGVTYTVSDKTAWQSQARAQAVDDARNRAQELAKLAEVELGEVLSVSEIVGGLQVPILGGERSMGGGGFAPGELEFTAQIQVTFAVQ